MKIMLVMTNCAKNYGSPIYQSLLENAGDATRNKFYTLFPQMHYPAQGKTGGKIFPMFASKNVYYLCGLDLTNRFHVAVRLFSNRSQMT